MKAFTSSIMLFLLIPLGSMNAASLQVVHNSPDPGSNEVDVVLFSIAGDSLWTFEDLRFLGASEVKNGLAQGVYYIAVRDAADPTVSIVVDNVLVLEETVVMLFGDHDDGGVWVGGDRFSVSPTPGYVGLKAWHGSPDAGSLDIVSQDGVIAFNGLSYGDATGMDASVSADSYVVSVHATDTQTILGTYLARLEELDGSLAVLFLSGFANGAPGLACFLADRDGTVVELESTVPVVMGSWSNVKARYVSD